MQKIALESFEDTLLQPDQPSAEFNRGYLEGFAAGKDADQSSQSALQNELVQAVSDLEFKYHEARSEITHAFAPLLSSLVDKVFPACISDYFSEHILSILQQAVDQNGTRAFTLHISPIQHDAVTATLAETNINVEIIADPALSQNAAWIGYGQNELQVNCDALLAEIRTVLSSADFIEIRSKTHG